jgi:hypothetical protein
MQLTPHIGVNVVFDFVTRPKALGLGRDNHELLTALMPWLPPLPGFGILPAFRTWPRASSRPGLDMLATIPAVEGRLQTVSGTVEFIWETEQELLVNLEPDRPGAPHTFEVGGSLRERLADVLAEGDKVEVDFVAISHEVVDPDSGATDSLRPDVRDVRVLRHR